MPHRVQERAAHAEHQPGGERQEQPRDPVRAESLERQAGTAPPPRRTSAPIAIRSWRSTAARRDDPALPRRTARYSPAAAAGTTTPYTIGPNTSSATNAIHDEPDPDDPVPRRGLSFGPASGRHGGRSYPERTPAAPRTPRTKVPTRPAIDRRSAVTVQHGQRTSSSPITTPPPVDGRRPRSRSTDASISPCSDRRTRRPEARTSRPTPRPAITWLGGGFRTCGWRRRARRGR